MIAAFERGCVLFEQRRYEPAVEQFEAALREDPDHAGAHSMLAICLQETGESKRALEEARHGVSLEPDSSYAHYVLSAILFDQDNLEGSLETVREAIRIDPSSADLYAIEGRIEMRLKHWQAALDAADRGLASDPEHVNCQNIRAQALQKLGRRAEAGEALDAALSRDPGNVETHVNVGWSHLEAGRTREALECFREALRIDPEYEAARHGVVQALKARHFIYRWVLAYFLWMSKLSDRAQWGVLLGAFFLSRLGGPILVVYLAFAALTWFASPLFDLMLLLHPVGKYALADRAARAALWIGGILGTALIGGVLTLSTGSSDIGLASLAIVGLVFPVSGYFQADRRRNQVMLLVGAILVALCAVTGIILLATGFEDADVFIGLAIVGGFFSTWVVNGLLATEK